ncbi:fosfomycin resistance glutathione transferase [Aliagarivorans marinus]|uniref:fosfomycin resistance glutathione transferase n=1 Tax=Aliagarivorans marinus TaxID=561965 RepID=UPI000418FA89|nr:fosfomycin resistance glutathione transferase [Aliagarivorans marinus]
MLTGLNHITVAVSDLERSLHFYTEILSFKGEVKWDNGAYLSLGELWLCLSCDAPQPATDYSHLAFSVAPNRFEAMRKHLSGFSLSYWKENQSEGDSLYLLDPDGHKLEIHAGDLTSRLRSLRKKPYSGLIWL